MDNTALTLCMDNHMPIIVFNLLVEGNLGTGRSSGRTSARGSIRTG